MQLVEADTNSKKGGALFIESSNMGGKFVVPKKITVTQFISDSFHAAFSVADFINPITTKYRLRIKIDHVSSRLSNKVLLPCSSTYRHHFVTGSTSCRSINDQCSRMLSKKESLEKNVIYLSFCFEIHIVLMDAIRTTSKAQSYPACIRFLPPGAGQLGEI